MRYEKHKEYWIGGRFALDPGQSAMANLARGISFAAHLVLTRKYNTSGYDTQTLKEIREDIELAGLVHFLYHRVRLHKYNWAYDFLTNCLSSVWSVAGNIIHQTDKRIQKRHATFSLNRMMLKNSSYFEVLPDGELLQNSAEQYPFIPTKRMKSDVKRPVHTMNKLVAEYTDYQTDCVIMGITPMSEEEWVNLNGSELEQEAYRRHKAGLDTMPEHRRHWLRDYQRARRAKLRAEKEAEHKLLLEDRAARITPGES